MKLFGTYMLAAVAARKKKGKKEGRLYADLGSFLSGSTPSWWTGEQSMTINYLKNARSDGEAVFAGDVWGVAKRGAGERMGRQYTNIVNRALNLYADCKGIELPAGTFPDDSSRRRRQADKPKKKNRNKKGGRKNKKKGEEGRGIPETTPDKLHWNMTWRVAMTVRETMMSDENCIKPAYSLFKRLDRYNLNANYQYCTNVADDANYCQWLQKDNEGNAISYKTARSNGTYTKFGRGGPITVFSPVCEVQDKPANANYDGDLYCPEGYAIEVDQAKYGRQTKGYCRGDSDSDISICRGSKTVIVTDVIAAQCNGKTTCVIEASNDALNGGVDPCPGVEKLAEVYHTCRKLE